MCIRDSVPEGATPKDGPSAGITMLTSLMSLIKQKRVKIYQKQKNVKINDIGYYKKVKGHHVFINSELGLYMDHFKGKRKKTLSSAKNDFRPQKLEATKNTTELDYWKKVPKS